MFRDLVISKLQSIPQEFTVHGDEIKTKCLNPEHNDSNPSYFINTKTGVSYCFSCGYAPHPAKIIGQSEEATEELLRQAKFNYLLKELTSNEDAETEQKVFYLPPKAYDINKPWRGISLELLQELGVYYCDSGRFSGRLIFPIYNNGVLQGYDARIVNSNKVREDVKGVKWLRPSGMKVQSIVYMQELLETKFRDLHHVVLTEGLLDAVSYVEMGVPAIPMFGLSDPDAIRISTMIRMGVSTVTLGVDNDQKALEALPRLYKAYKSWFEIKNHPLTYKIYKSGKKDANEYLQTR